MHVQRRIHLRQGERRTIPCEGRGGGLRRLDSVFALEGEIVNAPLKEVTKRSAQVAQGVLRGNLIEPCGFRLVIEDGERSGGLIIANTLLMLLGGIGAQAECPMVDVAHTAKGAGHRLLLLVGWVASLPVRVFLFHDLPMSTYHVNSYKKCHCHERSEETGRITLPSSFT